MALYFVEYDLRKKKEHDYQKLWDELETLKAVRVLQSSWCLKKDDTTAHKLFNQLRAFMHSGDGLVVSEVAGWWGVNTTSSPKDIS